MAEGEAQAETNEEMLRDPILDTDEMKKLFVGGIAPDAKDEDLKAFFEQICGGKVTDHVIIKKEGERKSNFGFITFESSELIDEVLLKRSELNFCSRNLDVNRAVPKNNTSAGAHEKTKKLFIANLPKFNCSEDDLKKYFEVRHSSKYGNIEAIQLIKKKDDQGNKTEENKGYGFVMVSSEDMADKMAIQHSTFEFGGRKIELKKSVPTNPGQEGRGRGRGASNRGGRGGKPAGSYNQPSSYGGGYGGAYGGGGDGWGGYYSAGYDYGYPAPAYGGGYGQAPSPRGGGRGRGQRFNPY